MAPVLPRIGIFGWGIIAPRSPDVETFETNLGSHESWMEPFNGFGPDNFLVGQPAFDLETYRDWIRERFAPNRFRRIESKIGFSSQYAIGAFIQALQQNPGIEQALQDLGIEAHVYIGTGLGDLPSIYDISIKLARSQSRWDRFWAQPERNAAVRAFREGTLPDLDPPIDPSESPEEERREAEDRWWHYWAAESDDLREYLRELRKIESIDVEGEVESGKKTIIRKKRFQNNQLQEKWGAPSPPWDGPSAAGIIWNIHNIPASQVSMMGRITGLSFAPVGACATFGITLKLAMNAIRLGEAKAVVIGAADPPPHALTVAAFYAARVISADGAVSRPLTGLRGTHVSGGAALWIVGDYEYMTARGFRPLGLEPLAVGVSNDADHIITPAKQGPLDAMKSAFESSGVDPESLTTWDLHATATPGDYLEVQNLLEIAPDSVMVTARKGTFGHGMGTAGGWELTAQYLGLASGELYPTPLGESDLNAEIAKLHENFAFDEPVAIPNGVAGKLSMGVGGVNSCVISRPWGKKEA